MFFNTYSIYIILPDEMLRLHYIRQLHTLSRKNNKFYAVQVARNNFCSVVSGETSENISSESPADHKNDPKEQDINSVMKGTFKGTHLVEKACEAVISINKLKKDSKINENDYKTDTRFQGLLKSLESNHVTKLEPLQLIGSLKV